MQSWTTADLANTILEFATIPKDHRTALVSLMNDAYPPELFTAHREKRRNALAQMNRVRDLLSVSTQHFPPYIQADSLAFTPDALKGFAIVFTAGGEGERLRLTLLKKGYSAASLENFTKATFSLPGFDHGFGTLHVNLIMVASLCNKYRIDIPVVITTGPEGSVTATEIAKLLAKYNSFGLRHVKCIPQDERLFLTNDEQIVLQEQYGTYVPITNPDETGGPIMKLKVKDPRSGTSVLDWFAALGCTKTIIVQATALYHQTVLPAMAAALDSHDCLGAGILRRSFPATDPYGTYAMLTGKSAVVTMILEQDIRNDATRMVTDPSGTFYLPFNTGFYAFRNTLLEQHDLPDFATPPKELRPDLPRSPKIGYAATDLITLAHDPIILTIDATTFGVLKNADDLELLGDLGKKFGLATLCEEFMRSSLL